MFGVVWLAVLALGSGGPGAPSTQEPPRAKRFTIDGTWDLDLAKSDEPGARVRRGFGGRGGFPGGRGGGWGGRGGRGRPQEPPPDDGAGGRGGEGGAGGLGMTATPYRLVFAQTDTVLTITIPGNSIRRVRLDRAERVDTALDGRITRVKTKIEESKLVIEPESDRGKFTESYELDRDTGELVVKTKVSGRRGSFDFKRVYVRAKDG